MIQLANGKRSAPNVVAHSGHGLRAVRAWVVLIRCRLRRCGRGLRPRECVTVSKTTASYHRCTVYPSGPWPRRALPSGPCSRRCSVSTGTPNLNLIQVHCPSRSSFCECGVAAGGLDVAIVGMCRGYACQKGFHCFLCSYRLFWTFSALRQMTRLRYQWFCGCWMRPWLKCADEGMYARAGLLDVGAECDGFGGLRRL